MITTIVSKKEGKYDRNHKLTLIGDMLLFDTADEEYAVGSINILELEEYIKEHKNKIENENISNR